MNNKHLLRHRRGLADDETHSLTAPISKRSNSGKFLAFGVLLLSLAFTGCMTNSDEKWNSRVGSLTVKQAVKELGRPQRAKAYSDGYQVGEWLTRMGTRSSALTHRGPTFSARVFDYSVLPREAPPVSDEYIRLLFGPDGKMVHWDRTWE